MPRYGGEGMKEQCQHCKFWERHNEDSLSGLCFRYPPVVIAEVITTVDGDTFSNENEHRPETHATDWCGEFKETRNEGNKA